MANVEIPSDQEVVDTLAALGERVTAVRLCQALVAAGHPIRQSQLAIQRAAERGHIEINSDWSLSAIKEAIAA